MAKNTPEETAAATCGLSVSRADYRWKVGGTHGSVDGGVLSASERHVGDGAGGAVASLSVRGYILDAGNNASVGAGTAVVEHLDGIELGLLGYAIGDAADGTGNVSAMAVAISIVAVASEVLEPLSTYLKVNNGFCEKQE